ncbi:hypothetical protein [Roseibium sediminicola]|uniref:Uncharacterized protein n=1 Tax=Roseibium sediminicola TaxID=2933272 RepID=A0ABT0H2Z8_9HYPH|nr:hypothetical protein [Roseibium sp. CAU 1639]MCK7616067.1 hypothetical protein [Roseibium sp. CAU 1639]
MPIDSLEAYRRSKDRTDIPVTVFQGSVDEAVLTAAKANTQSVLPMDNRQRQNLAWRLALTSKFSKQQIKAYAGISDGQVATMRRIKKALGDDAYEHESWWAARRAAEGKPIVTLSEDEMEEWMDEKAQRWADRLAKHFSTKMAQNPVIAARALERHFGRKLPELCRELDKLAPLDDLAEDEYEPEDF